MNCQYCGMPADGTNEHNENVCATCDMKHYTANLVTASARYNEEDRTGGVFVEFFEDWIEDGGAATSSMLTVTQARWVVAEIEQAIKFVEARLGEVKKNG